MRSLRVGLVVLLAAAAAACVPSIGPGSPTAVATPTSAISASPTVPAPATSATASPVASPVPIQGAAEGPLAVDGQKLTALVAAAGSPLRYATLGPGLARTDDGGLTWRKVSDISLPLPLVSGGDARLLYAGKAPSCYKDEETPPFRYSADGGSTWTELPGGAGIAPVAAVAGSAGAPEKVYGISCRGLSVSNDGGATWQLTGATIDANITAIMPTSDGGKLRFLAVLTSEGGSSHLAWFDDSGALRQDPGPGVTFWGAGALSAAGSTLYVGDSMGVWRQRGGGGWERFSAGLDDVVLKADPLEQGLSEEDAARSFGLLALASDPLDPQRLALGTARGLYLSLDGGEHWQLARVEGLVQSRTTQVVWEPLQPNTLYATTPEGVYTVHLR